MPTLPNILRLLALSVLLSLTLPTIAAEKAWKDDLDTQKEFLQLKIENGKELLQKDIEVQGKRIEAVDKRVDDR